MVAFVAIISILSCKKEIDYSDPNSNGCQLKSWKVTSGSDDFTLSFEYNAAGQAIKESLSTGETYTRVFTASKITGTDDDGVVDELILSNGRAISSGSGGEIQAGIARFETTKKYGYDGDGYLSKVETYQNGILVETNVFSYADGNLIKSVIREGSAGEIQNTTTFTYRSEKAVNTSFSSDPLTTFVDYQKGGYFGKPSKNFIASASYTSFDPLGNILVIDNSLYSYQFDSKGNATLLNITSTSTLNNGGAGTPDTSTDKYEMIYNCK